VRALFAFALLVPWGAHAETIIKGQLIDQTASSAVTGASLEVRRGDDLLGTGTSDADGRFSLAVDAGAAPEARVLTLLARHPDFAEASQNVVVSAGAADRPFYRLELLPRSLVRCRLQQAHGVVVGYFRSPTTEEQFRDLSSRIADALTYSLLTRLQEVHVPSDFQPLFLECTEAKPRSITLAGAYARALGADAFVSGDVNPDDGRFRVSAYVGDRFELFVPPRRTVNPGVNLDDPGAAQLDPLTHGAILVAIASGYERAGRYAECVDVTVAAGRLVEDTASPVARALLDKRADCQAQLANRGLLRGTQP